MELIENINIPNIGLKVYIGHILTSSVCIDVLLIIKKQIRNRRIYGSELNGDVINIKQHVIILSRSKDTANLYM